MCVWLLSVCPQEGVWHPDKIVVKSDDPLQVEKFIALPRYMKNFGIKQVWSKILVDQA